MFSSDKWFGATSAEFYNGVISRSLRLDATSQARLESPSFSSDGGDTWTWSAWVKFHDLSKAKQVLFGRSGNNACLIYNDGGTGEGELDLNDDGAVVRRSTGFFRDVSNWYHVTLNGNGTVNRLWVNAVEVDFPSTANIGQLNVAAVHYIGYGLNTNFYADITFADINFVSGTALDYSAFAEFKNGVLIPIEPSVTYGANGFRLQFLQTGSGADASGIGADTSGNGNHFTATNLDSHDVITDCPENNFCTMNGEFADITANTIDEGGLKVTTSTSGRSFTSGTFLMTSGKWYWEFRVDANSGGMGVAKVNGAGGAGAYQSATSSSTSTNTTDYYYGETNWVMYGDGIVHNGGYVGGTSGGMGSPSYPQIWGVAVDMDASPPTISYYINGSSVGSADLDTGFDYIPIAGDGSGGVSRIIHVNFGQNPTFNGEETAGTNTDGNGNGLFHDAVPSGHLALCASNLPDTTISPNQDTQADDHFNTVLYIANNSTNAVTGVGFQPDWVWIKRRTAAAAHALWDSSRGAQKWLYSDGTAAEISTSDGLSSFDPDGFTLGADSYYGSWNNSGNHVSWNWKANGGTTTSDTTGSLTVNRQTNSDAQFSIITGTTSNVQANDMTETFGHGLSGTPDYVVVKTRSASNIWAVWTSAISINNLQGLQFNTNGALYTNSVYKTVQATSSVVQIGRQAVENNGTTFVCYAFKAVEGYSKFGSYTGNGSTDGSYIFTSFRPSFIMVKRTDSSGNWTIYDNVRLGYNVANYQLYPNLSNSEGSSTHLDILSNGFKWRTSDASRNASSGTYIYMAFAEQPFKFSNAR